MQFQKGRKKTGGRKKGTPNKVVSLQFTRDAFKEIQDAFVSIATQKPKDFSKKAEAGDIRQFKNMWEFLAMGMMGKLAKTHNPQMAESYMKFIFGNTRMSDIIGHEESGELREHISRIRVMADTGSLTIEKLVAWYGQAIEKFSNDSVAMRTINRVHHDTLAALTAKETIDLNKNNSVPVKTLNTLLTRNSLTVQKILANHPDLLEQYAEQWTGDMQEILLNVMDESQPQPQPEPVAKKKPVRKKTVAKKKKTVRKKK